MRKINTLGVYKLSVARILPGAEKKMAKELGQLTGVLSPVRRYQ